VTTRVNQHRASSDTNRHHTRRSEPGLTDALVAYFRAAGGRLSVARNNQPLAIRAIQQVEGIRGEDGIGPRTEAVLRRFSPDFRPVASPFAVDRRSAEPVRIAARAAAPALAAPPPRSSGVRVQAPAASAPSWWERMFGGATSTGSSAAQNQLLASVRSLKPNHAYVVQLDVNNDGRNTAAMKGRTYVFATDAGCNLSLRGTFTSSSQPFRGNPYGPEGVSAHANKAGTYRYPYIPEGVYPMGTTAVGLTGGLAINVNRAARDTNRDGRIDANEARQLSSTSLIRFHSASLGSAGCQTIQDNEWASFIGTVGRYGGTGATYVLRRT
jgi:hypothetical protein